MNLVMIGCGAIGSSVLQMLESDQAINVTAIVVSADTIDFAKQIRDQYAPAAAVVTTVPEQGVDLILEVAGHGALVQHVLPALQRGMNCIVASVGALSDEDLYTRLVQAATDSGAQLQLIPGAIGAIDALAAARYGDLTQVVYTGRKPPLAWQGTPADGLFDLKALTEPTVIFEGSARQAAEQYPKNANVAATVSLAGLGLDQTKVQLIADPTTSENEHHVLAKGAFGSFELRMQNLPLALNPKTSALTAYSAVRAVRNAVYPVVI